MMQIEAKLNTNKHVMHVKRTITFKDNGVSFEVADYRIKQKLDEIIYENEKELWEILPRCFAIVKYDSQIIRVICGLRKFGDEKQFIADVPGGYVADHEVYLNKANGEYCSASMFSFKDINYFVIRSKNVSIILRKDNFIADLEMYTEPRYDYVREMAITFHKMYFSPYVSDEQRDRIDKKMLSNTINMEFCSPKYQHLVDYEGETKLLPFAITTYSASSNGLTSMFPNDAQRWFYEVGLGGLSFMHNADIRNDVTEREKVRNKVFNEDNSEGAVVYQVYKNYNTGDEKVYHVYKYKNYKYIFWRAVREKMRSKSTILRMINRLKNLHVTVPDIDILINEAIQFYAYCTMTATDKNPYENVFSQWVTKKKEFTEFVSKHPAIINQYVEEFKKIDAGRQQIQIMSIGFPGSGKSTVMKCLQKLIEGTERVNQDECNGSVKVFHKKVNKLSMNQNVKVLLLDKCYHNKKVRGGTFQAMNTQRLIYLVFYHPSDCHFEKDESNVQLVFDQTTNVEVLIKERINKRGFGHLTLHPGPKLEGIINGFRDSFEYLTNEESEMADTIIYIDMTKPLNEQIKHALNFLEINSVNDARIEKAISDVAKDESMLANKMKTK